MSNDIHTVYYSLYVQYLHEQRRAIVGSAQPQYPRKSELSSISQPICLVHIHPSSAHPLQLAVNALEA